MSSLSSTNPMRRWPSPIVYLPVPTLSTFSVWGARSNARPQTGGGGGRPNRRRRRGAARRLTQVREIDVSGRDVHLHSQDADVARASRVRGDLGKGGLGGDVHGGRHDQWHCGSTAPALAAEQRGESRWRVACVCVCVCLCAPTRAQASQAHARQWRDSWATLPPPRHLKRRRLASSLWADAADWRTLWPDTEFGRRSGSSGGNLRVPAGKVA